LRRATVQALDLRTLFRDPDVLGTAVRVSIRLNATIKTMDIALFDQEKPITVANFLAYVNAGRYASTFFHRSVPGFVVQFGDPQSKTLPLDDPKMGSGGPGYTIKAEFNKRPFERGVLGMARTNDPDSAGSQVYIMLGPAPFLNGKYTAFGKVATGMGVVDQIKIGDRIKTIRIVTK